MKKMYFLVLSLFVFTLSACSSVYAGSYETIELKVSYTISTWHTLIADEDPEQRLIGPYGQFVGGSCELDFGEYEFYSDEDMFLADGDILRLTYSNDFELSNKIYAKDMVKIERIANESITKVDEESIERGKKGYIVNINPIQGCATPVVMSKDYTIGELGSSCITELYMSSSMHNNGEEYIVYYAFNPIEN